MISRCWTGMFGQRAIVEPTFLPVFVVLTKSKFNRTFKLNSLFWQAWDGQVRKEERWT